MLFCRNTWNIEHVARHGVRATEIEETVIAARRPFPRRAADDKQLICGPTAAGRLLQDVFALDEDDVVFVIHARPLTDRERRRRRRRTPQ